MASKNQNVFVNIQEVHDVVCAPFNVRIRSPGVVTVPWHASFRTFLPPRTSDMCGMSSAVRITPLLHGCADLACLVFFLSVQPWRRQTSRHVSISVCR